MASTPEENDAAAVEPAVKPRRRRAASRPAGPPVHAAPVAESAPAAEPVVEPEPVAPAPVDDVAPAVEAEPVVDAASDVTVEPVEEAVVQAPARRTRRSTRKAAAPAPAAVEPTPAPEAVEAVAAQEPETTTTPDEAAVSEPVAPKRRTRRPRKTAAPAVEEQVAPEQVAADPVQAPAATQVAPVEVPAEQEVVVEAPAAPVATGDLTDLMDDPVLMRAAGIARGDASPADRAAEAAARATALFFQAPDVEDQPRRSRRASAPAGPPRVVEHRPEDTREDRAVAHEDLHDDDEDDVWDGTHDHEDGPARPVAEDRDDADEDRDDTDEGDGHEDDAEGGSTPRRRRRRGGRGRRSRTREDGEDGEVSEEEGSEDASTEDTGTAHAEDEDEDESTDGDDGDEPNGSSSRRRRRRRRRSGGGDGEETSPDDPPNTVTRVREPRRSRSSSGAAAPAGTGEDEITALKGSTRLEAKKQRRREGREAGRKRSILTEAEFLARRESVERVMVVRELEGRTQIGVLEDGILVEHYAAKQTQTTMVGNVYLGRVQNVLPSMEAAFIDVGKGRNAVLYAGEVNWDAAGLEGQPRRIEAALKSGDPVLVQVTKDPVGHKGARLTSQVSLPGRYLVYVPRGSMTGISRKLPDTERTRLKKVLKKVVPEGAGVIVRTAAEGVAEEDLAADVQRLQATWEAIQAKSSSKNAPVLLHGEPDLGVRVVRDVFNEDFTSLVVSGDEAWETVHGYVSDVAPDLVERLERWEPSEPGDDVFAAHRIDEQLQKALGRKVYLPSGGSLVIDPTEAMHVIDVNTGKFTGAGGTLEETVTRNNLEAAEEIVRQLRLRDIGGIIVIDFIDMVLESNRDLVLRRLVECLGRDRTKHQVAEVTSLGLVQMTRKRTGQGLAAVLDELESEDAPEPSGGGSGGGGSSSGSGSGGGSSRGGQSSEGAGGTGKSRSRRGRGRDRSAEGDDEAQDAPAAAAKEPARNEAVLAAMAAVAAAAARREAGDHGDDQAGDHADVQVDGAPQDAVDVTTAQ